MFVCIIFLLYRYHGSFVGRDYKAWAQMCLFIVQEFLTDSEESMAEPFKGIAMYHEFNIAELSQLLFFLQVFRIAYCDHFHARDLHYTEEVCKEFIQAVKEFDSSLF